MNLRSPSWWLIESHNALLDIEELEEDRLDAFRTKDKTLAELAR